MDLSSNSTFLAQSDHVGWGLGLSLALALFLPAVWACACIAALAAAKEAVEVAWGVWEPKQPVMSSVVDWAWWCVGIGAAGLPLWLAK